MNITIDPKYISYIITVDANGKTTVKVIIKKSGLPENVKKVHLSYVYIKALEEPEVEPESITPDPIEPNPTNLVVSTNFVENPVTGSGLETNAFGVALAGSVVPTAADFVTYGE